MASQEFTPTELENEEWRDIPGFEGYYQVSNLGRVRSLDRRINFRDGRSRFYYGQMLRPAINTNGYPHVILCVSGGNLDVTVHKLVTLAFFGERPDGHEVNHKDGRTANNRLKNLEYVTRSENALHGIHVLGGKRVGPKGVRAPSAKLTPKDVRAMRQMRKETGLSYAKIGKRFGVSKPTCMNAVKRKTWKHVD